MSAQNICVDFASDQMKQYVVVSVNIISTLAYINYKLKQLLNLFKHTANTIDHKIYQQNIL